MKGVTSRPLMNYGFSFWMLLYCIFKFIQKLFPHLKRKILKKRNFKHIGYIHRILFWKKVYSCKYTLFLENCYHFVVNIVGLIFIDNQPQSCQWDGFPPFTAFMVFVPNIVEYPADNFTSFMITQSTWKSNSEPKPLLNLSLPSYTSPVMEK